jgi:hypothetical protein
MAQTNFKVFNEEMSSDRTFNDSEYSLATQRQGGVIPGMALSRLHNKLYRQSTAMAKAIADFLVVQGYDAMDNNIEGITLGLRTAIEGIIADKTAGMGINTLKRNHIYAVGDVAFSPNLPTWARLDCIVAGTTAEVESTWGTVIEGQQIVDGSATWLIADVKHAFYG